MRVLGATSGSAICFKCPSSALTHEVVFGSRKQAVAPLGRGFLQDLGRIFQVELGREQVEANRRGNANTSECDEKHFD